MARMETYFAQQQRHPLRKGSCHRNSMTDGLLPPGGWRFLVNDAVKSELKSAAACYTRIILWCVQDDFVHFVLCD